MNVKTLNVHTMNVHTMVGQNMHVKTMNEQPTNEQPTNEQPTKKQSTDGQTSDCRDRTGTEVSAAFTASVSPYLDEIRHYCAYLTASKWDGEDLLQDVLLKLYLFFTKKGSFTYPRPLLYKAARNLWIDQNRKGRLHTVPIEDMAHLSCDRTDYTGVRDWVDWLADRLTKRELKMFVLAELFDYSYEHISEECKCTLSVVKNTLHRTKRQLRTYSIGAVDAKQTAHAAAAKSSKHHWARQELEYWVNAIVVNDIR